MVYSLRERAFRESVNFVKGDTVAKKMKPFTRQLSLPLQADDPFPVPAETQRDLERVLADLLLSVAVTDMKDDGRKQP